MDVRDIFVGEPEKYVQAWLPVYQIFKETAAGDSTGSSRLVSSEQQRLTIFDYVGSPTKRCGETGKSNARRPRPNKWIDPKLTQERRYANCIDRAL